MVEKCSGKVEVAGQAAGCADAAVCQQVLCEGVSSTLTEKGNPFPASRDPTQELGLHSRGSCQNFSWS